MSRVIWELEVGPGGIDPARWDALQMNAMARGESPEAIIDGLLQDAFNRQVLGTLAGGSATPLGSNITPIRTDLAVGTEDEFEEYHVFYMGEPARTAVWKSTANRLVITSVTYPNEAENEIVFVTKERAIEIAEKIIWLAKKMKWPDPLCPSRLAREKSDHSE